MNALEPKSLRSGSKPGTALMILAAGASSRLGRPKQLLPFQGRSLLRHAAETALASVCRPVVVVLGAFAERFSGELTGLPVTVVTNRQWEEGMASSIRAGLNALVTAAGGPDAIIIMLCDQPLISAQFLDRLATAHHDSGRPVVAAGYGGTGGVPALFSRACYPELALLRGSRGARALIVKYAKNSEWIPLPEAVVDIDREEDVKRLE